MDNRPAKTIWYSYPIKLTLVMALLLVSGSFIQLNAQALDKVFPTLPDSVKPITDTPGLVMGTDPRLVAPPDTTFKDTIADSTFIKAQLKPRKHSVKKAAIFSAVLPGLGQIYNKKYWKLPIFYAGFAGLGYAVFYTADKFHAYRKHYIDQLKDPATVVRWDDAVGADDLKAHRDYYKRYMDISAICMGVWYILNIVDATVDAHLFEWNMSDNLSARWEPSFINSSVNYNTAAVGVKLTIRFR